MPPKRNQQYRHLPAFVLLLLTDGPAHGGAILTELTRRMPRIKTDSAAVYRTLQQLEQDGALNAEWETGQSGPARKRYTLTPAGWNKLDEWRLDIEGRIASLQYFLDTLQAATRHAPQPDKDSGHE